MNQKPTNLDPASIRITRPPKNAHAQALSRLGASKGGIARREALSREKRLEISRKANLVKSEKNLKNKSKTT